MSEILDYRTPANELRLRRIARALRAREAFSWVKAAAMLTLGSAASLVGPAAVTWVVWTIWNEQMQVTATALFVLSCLVMLSLLYWLELRTRGNFLTDELRAQGHSVEEGVRSLVSGRGDVRQAGALYAMYVEIFLFGPRMTIDAVRWLTARLRVGRAPIERAAEIVMLLSAADGGLAVQGVSRGQTVEELRRTLQYLRLNDWIDLGDHGRRVRLLSTARRRLPA